MVCLEAMGQTVGLPASPTSDLEQLDLLAPWHRAVIRRVAHSRCCRCCRCCTCPFGLGGRRGRREGTLAGSQMLQHQGIEVRVLFVEEVGRAGGAEHRVQQPQRHGLSPCTAPVASPVLDAKPPLAVRTREREIVPQVADHTPRADVFVILHPRSFPRPRSSQAR